MTKAESHFIPKAKGLLLSTYNLLEKISIPELDTLIANSMSLIVDDYGCRLWTCDMCGKTNKDRQDMRRHMETHFPGFEHQCPYCDKQSKSRNALRNHISRNHKNC